MQGTDYGLIGTVGGLLGLIGGLAGAYAELRRAKSQRERKFIFGWTAIVLLFTATLVLCNIYLPLPYSVLVIIPYLVILLPASFWCSRRLRQLREKTGERMAKCC